MSHIMTTEKPMSALAALAIAASMWTFPASAVSVPGQGTWQSTLLARDLNGDATTDAFYDTSLNVTWLRDANVNGRMNWIAANTWAGNLNVGGITGWRLPTMVDTGTSGCNFSFTGTDCGYNVQTKNGSTVYSEMAHLFYVTLGNTADVNTLGIEPQAGSGLTNTGNFQNLQSGHYWFGLELAPFTGNAWVFDTSVGSQASGGKFNALFGLAVRPGDVAAVPEPESWALMLAGALMVAGSSRSRKAPSSRRCC
jgi:hypothetical protein